jgi:hypothetical protein
MAPTNTPEPPVTAARPVQIDLRGGWSHRLMMGAFRLADRRRQARWWSGRRRTEYEYAITGPIGGDEAWNDGEADLRCWVLPPSGVVAGQPEP